MLMSRQVAVDALVIGALGAAIDRMVAVTAPEATSFPTGLVTRKLAIIAQFRLFQGDIVLDGVGHPSDVEVGHTDQGRCVLD